MKVWCIKYTLGRVNRFKSCWWNGSIYKKSNNIYKLDNLIKNLIFEYTGILYGNKLKNYKFTLDKINL